MKNKKKNEFVGKKKKKIRKHVLMNIATVKMTVRRTFVSTQIQTRLRN